MGPPTVVGDRVVSVALFGGAAAAGEDAGGLADVDQVPQSGGGFVGGCLPGVVAVPGVEQGQGEGPRPVAGLGVTIAGSGRRPAAFAGPGRGPGAAPAGGWSSAGAAVGNWPAIGPGEGEAQLVAGVGGQGVGEFPGVGGVEWPVSGGVARFLGDAEPGGQGQGQVDAAPGAGAGAGGGCREGARPVGTTGPAVLAGFGAGDVGCVGLAAARLVVEGPVAAGLARASWLTVMGSAAIAGPLAGAEAVVARPVIGRLAAGGQVTAWLARPAWPSVSWPAVIAGLAAAGPTALECGAAAGAAPARVVPAGPAGSRVASGVPASRAR